MCILVACVLFARAAELLGHPKEGRRWKDETGTAALLGLPAETGTGSEGSAEQTWLVHCTYGQTRKKKNSSLRIPQIPQTSIMTSGAYMARESVWEGGCQNIKNKGRVMDLTITSLRRKRHAHDDPVCFWLTWLNVWNGFSFSVHISVWCCCCCYDCYCECYLAWLIFSFSLLACPPSGIFFFFL